MRIVTDFERRFPKWLIGDSADDRVFVVHLHWPRFFGEVVEGPLFKVEPSFIDMPVGLAASELARLMCEAGDFYIGEIKRGMPLSYSKPKINHENMQRKN
jgi:hypothetical protein